MVRIVSPGTDVGGRCHEGHSERAHSGVVSTFVAVQRGANRVAYLGGSNALTRRVLFRGMFAEIFADFELHAVNFP
jgi:hypothetical protein